jgi:hypothetical protein
MLLLESKTDAFLSIWQVFWLTRSALSSHATMASHSDVTDWASTLELTAAGLRRTLTGFPFHTLPGDQNGGKSTK